MTRHQLSCQVSGFASPVISLIVARDDEAGLRFALNGRFDPVLGQIRLPSLNALKVLGGLRNTVWCPPVAVLTNENHPEYGARARLLGAVDYIIKRKTKPRQLVEGWGAG